MTFTARESAADVYGVVAGMGRGSVRGADMNEVTAARIDTCDRAEQAITQALAGPQRRFAAEPDDVTLRRWLQQVQRRRAALRPAT